MNEEAIEILKGVQDNYKSDDEYDYSTDEYQEIVDAFDMAIAALKAEPCEDSVNREAALKALCYACSIHQNGGKCSRCDGYNAISDLPPVTPKQKTGKWKIVQVLHGEWEGTKKYACDKCGEKVGVFKSNYCPNCGAKMEGESE